MAGLFNVDLAGLGTAISSVGGLAKDIRSAITGKVDPTVEAQLQQHLADLDAQLAQAQNTVNAAEAASPHLFVSGWRPFIGWICGIALFVNFIVNWAVKLLYPDMKVPEIDSGLLYPLVLGMIGMAGAHAYENVKGNQ